MRIILLIVILIMTGCDGNPRNEATLLRIDQIDESETEIKKTISAELNLYRDQRSALMRAAGRQAWVEQELETRYRIIKLTDRAIVQDKGLQVSVLMQFLREENAQARVQKADEDKRKDELETNYQVSFDSLTFRQRQLSSTRTKLLTLTQGQSAKDQLSKRIIEAQRWRKP